MGLSENRYLVPEPPMVNHQNSCHLNTFQVPKKSPSFSGCSRWRRSPVPPVPSVLFSEMARWLLGAEVLKLTLAWCQVSWWVCWMSALRLRPLLRSPRRAEWSLGAGRSLVETAGVCRSRSDICSYRGMRGSEWRNLVTGRCFLPCHSRQVAQTWPFSR